METMDIDPVRSAASVHEYMAQRAAAAAEPSSSDDEDETAAALAEAAAARADRRAAEAGSRRATAVLAHEAQRAVARGALMDGVQRYTEALELSPHDVELLAERGSLCARINHAHAALHDGELIVRLMPDWFKGHAICGLALFCMKQYAPACLAYRRAVAHAAGSPFEGGLREALQDAQAKAGGALRQAAVSGDVEGLRAQLSSSGADPELRDEEHGFTALSLAAAAGKAACAALLVRAGAEVECRDRYGKTPLIWAASGGHEAAAQALLKGGAALRAEDQSGWDALMAACSAGHTRLATVWLQGADLSRAARDGTTCLHAAARGGHGALVKLLLHSAANPAARDRAGQRPLELARVGGHADVVAALLPLTPVLAEAP